MPILAALGLCVLAPAPAWAQSVAWIQQTVSGPSPRNYHAMAYDAARGVTVLFGGADNSGSNSETWEWNGTAWTQRAVSGPSHRNRHAMAYDSTRGVTVLFGGEVNSGTGYSGETWEWNGNGWTQRLVTGPSPRLSHAMAYDAARGVTVLFGGYTSDSGPLNSGETWEWNGTVWTLRSASGPLPRNMHAMAYDAALGVTVLFGGYSNEGGVERGETWEWNGTAWTQRAVNGPSQRYNHAMAYDAARGVTVLFGGTYGGGETWEWNGTGGGAWTQRMVGGPSLRSGHAMAYDAARGVTVLFGGYPIISSETWTLGVCVAPSITAQPSAQAVCPTGSASFTTTAAGTGPFTYQWQIEDSTSPGTWLGITDGVNSPPGWPFTASGATTATLQTGTYPPGWLAARFRCIVTNACGSTASGPATVTVCLADYNCDGQITPADIAVFVNAWFTSLQDGTLAGDFDHNDILQPFDVAVFVNAWFNALTTGC